MFEQRRCQRGATREDKVRAVLRLDAANALDDVRSKALERAPFKTFMTMGSDIFCCRIEAVRHRTARRLWPEARPGPAPCHPEWECSSLQSVTISRLLVENRRQVPSLRPWSIQKPAR